MFTIRHARLRRIESARLIRLALPIVGAQLAQVGMGTVDVAMTGHASATDLAAVSIGSSLWLPLVLFAILSAALFAKASNRGLTNPADGVVERVAAVISRPG